MGDAGFPQLMGERYLKYFAGYDHSNLCNRGNGVSKIENTGFSRL